MAVASKGTLVLCDPSIKALIVQMDSQRHDIVLEELDDTHLLVQPSMVQFLKTELNALLSKNVYDPFEEEEEDV